MASFQFNNKYFNCSYSITYISGYNNKSNKKIMKYEKGDKLELIKNTEMTANLGATAIVLKQSDKATPNNWVRIKWLSNDNGQDGGEYDNSRFKLINNKKKTMSNVLQTIKNLTRKEPQKSFIKAGFMNENEEITEDGKEILEHILWKANEEKLKEYADKILLEQNKE